MLCITNNMQSAIRYSCRKPSPTQLESVVEAVGGSYTHCRKDKFVVLYILTWCDVLMLMHTSTSFTWINVKV